MTAKEGCTNSTERLKAIVAESNSVKSAVLEQCSLSFDQVASAFITSLGQGNKVLLCGNGGSASDAQHVASELVGRFQRNRRGLPAIALTTDGAMMTSISNDFGYDKVFSRQVEALAVEGDIVVGISTSGESPSILQAMKSARMCGAVTIGITGQSGGKLKDITDFCLCVPSTNTARIQEAHITIWHALCEIVEETLFSG